jgi:hypothetical protein
MTLHRLRLAAALTKVKRLGLRSAWFFLLYLALSGCTKPKYAVYLIEGERGHVDHKRGPDVARARLVQPPVLTEKEIIAYDWATHLITLTPSAEKKLFDYETRPNEAPGARLAGREFVVTANGVRCYGGAFWSSIMWGAYNFPSIVISTRTNTIQIQRGFPPSGDDAAPDPRADARVMKALKEAGKLKKS